TIKVGGKNINYYIHRLVAEQFCRKPSPRHNFVIHLDHKKENNLASNLRWVTHATQIEHAKKDPAFLAQLTPYQGKKLNADRVKVIKRKLASGRTRMKILAKQFGISEMQLYRIKSGENWSHVNICPRQVLMPIFRWYPLALSLYGRLMNNTFPSAIAEILSTSIKYGIGLSKIILGTGIVTSGLWLAP